MGGSGQGQRPAEAPAPPTFRAGPGPSLYAGPALSHSVIWPQPPSIRPVTSPDLSTPSPLPAGSKGSMASDAGLGPHLPSVHSVFMPCREQGGRMGPVLLASPPAPWVPWLPSPGSHHCHHCCLQGGVWVETEACVCPHSCFGARPIPPTLAPTALGPGLLYLPSLWGWGGWSLASGPAPQFRPNPVPPQQFGSGTALPHTSPDTWRSFDS